MAKSRLLSMFALLATMLAFGLVPEAARADERQNPVFAPTCHAASGLEVTIEEMARSDAWICSNDDWTASEPVAWLRFESDSWFGEKRPGFFFSRIARFEAITLGALDAGGSVRSVRYLEADGEPFPEGPVFQLELPEVTADTSAVLVRIERPHSIPLLTEARVTFDSEGANWSPLEMMLLSLVVGMLVLPLFFDLSFFIVLRDRSVAYHAAMVSSMMVYVVFAGGLITIFADLQVSTIAVVGPLFWAIGCGLSALFLAEFLEDGIQSRWIRRLTVATGIWTILVPGFFALQLHATQPFDDQGYFLTFLPAIAIITFAIANAVWKGSRSARFLAVAWAPIILSSAERLLRGLGVYVGPSSLDQMLYVAAAFEVTVLSIAIAVRFLSIRRERDAALFEARMLEQLSTHDQLTSLINRRALEDRFEQLREQGFDTFALIDLDRFKDINDQFGHQTGDAVLVASADAIRCQGDRDLIAVRLGGEEFVLLLRGKHATARAENLRQSIPSRVAAEVPGLDRPVTASMGVLELPRDALGLMEFDEIYARADKLLYEAKEAGRNRMLYERLRVFDRGEASRSKRKVAVNA